MTGVLGVPVSEHSLASATQTVMEWAEGSESRSVCVTNVHSVMEAFDSPAFRSVLKGADMVLPDGMPLVWMMRLKGLRRQPRVYGPALMQQTLLAAARRGIPVGLYGSSANVLDALGQRLARDLPTLRIVFRESPPFVDLKSLESGTADERVLASGARILFVGLGCPKQELWMAQRRGRIPAVMIGVGAAFDFLAGTKPQAPRWVQSAGLEWLFRLVTEPRRLWKRYLVHNPRFLILAAADLLGVWRRQC